MRIRRALHAPDGPMRKSHFRNAPVGLHIFLLNHVAKIHSVMLDDDRGVLIHKPGGAELPFVVRNGVYFMKLGVPRQLLHSRADDQSFHGRGTA